MNCRKEHWGLEFTPEEVTSCRKNNGLLSMELELSRACNLRCIYCYASSGKPLPNELSLPEIFSVIDQAVALGAKKIVVLGGGEPLLYPDIFKVIDYISSANVQVDLFTNATLLDSHKAKALFDKNVSISMKLNSRDQATQDYLAGKDGTFTAIQKGMKELIAAGYPDEEHTLGIETIICKQNYDEIPEMWRWARKQDIIPYIEVMTSQGRATCNGGLEVKPEKIKILFDKLAAIDAEEFGCKWTPIPPLAASHCARHEYSCTVTSTGEIHPCPGVNVAAGNIRHQSLAEILEQSSIINDLRNIRENIKGNCSTCEHKQLCYGCRGHAYQVTGDYLAPDPICWIHQSEDKKK